MIELTNEQWQALANESDVPPRVVNPNTHAKYVLVREEVYDQFKQIFDAKDSEFITGMTPHVLEVFGRDGWDDVSMDVYNDLDPRR